MVLIGRGDITREELEHVLQKMLKKQVMNKEKTNLKVDMEIKS
tara:strand:+ start:801 stop:929 length:129 start_codon:yes stop_codon:yes gene_type:complete